MTGRRIARFLGDLRRCAPRRVAPARIAALALLAFSLRGLIPLGFMPAQGSLGVVLCHEDFPAHFFSHGAPSRGKPGSGERDSHCLFCGGTSPAPAFTLAGIARITPVSIGVARFSESFEESVRPTHTPQARAPPHPV